MKTFFGVLIGTIIGQTIAGVVTTIIKVNRFNVFAKKVNKFLNGLLEKICNKKARYNPDDYVDAEYREA